MNLRTYIQILSLCMVLYLLDACRKDTITVSSTTTELGEDINVRKICFVSGNIGFACGGKRNENGSIYKTLDAGQSWQKIYSNTTDCIYSVYFLNDTLGYACGDQLLLLKTVNGGLTWNAFQYPELPIARFVVPLMDIYFTDNNKGYILGGDTYENGIVLRTYDGGNFWIYYGFNNELRSQYFSDANHGIVSGYGGMFETNDGGVNYQALSVKDDFFTSLHFNDPLNGFACGYDGGIYMSTDGGHNWTKKFDGSKAFKRKMHFNAIRFLNSTSGYAVGNDGLILFTNDTGAHWKQLEKITDKNLFAIAVNLSGKIFITSEQGKIFILTP